MTDLSICQSIMHQPINGVLIWLFALYRTVYNSVIYCPRTIAAPFSFRTKMEATSKEGKEKRSSNGALYKVVIVVVVLAICAGFGVGLELFRRRLVALEETVNGLSEICRTADHQANRSNQRNRRDTSSVTLEDVRSEIQKQLGSVTGSQLCSPPDKICLAGPPGSKGNAGMPGLKGRRGKKGNQGEQGYKGNVGFGSKGDAGYPGVKGGIGAPGPPGLDGQMGQKGNEGIPGFMGMKGDPGYAGMDGVKGGKGSKGDVGDPTMPGNPGPMGPKGDKGIAGYGLKGDPGSDGYPGPKGEQGEKGNKGDPGVGGSSTQGSPGKAPTIFVSPRTLTVMENDPVTLNCFATGQPVPSVKWERPGSGGILAQNPSGALKITKAQAWHSGKYTCRAFNSHGMTESTVELKVKGKPVIRERFLSSRSGKITVNAYQDVTMFCQVSGYPAPVVTWQKPDYTDMPEGRTEISNDRLVIRKIRVEESAVYVCKAQNAYGSEEMRYTVSVTPRGGRGRGDAARNCKELKAQIPSTASGRYWIDPDLGSTDNAYEAYCDQETDGGGWTLVWSFGYKAGKSSIFTKFMTPRPSIPTHPSASKYRQMSPLSTTIPFNTSALGAMNFSLWKTLGTEVLLQSNQINWYICKDGSGSIVKWTDGSISCRVAKTLIARCSHKAPNYIATDLNYGMKLTDGRYSNYFYKVAVMESSYSGGRRLDACGRTYGGNLVRANNPRGAWFVR